MTYKLTEEATDRVAKALAEAANGGKWETHYTEEQKQLWRRRAAVTVLRASNE